MMYLDRVLSRIFWVGRRKLYNEDLHNSYCKVKGKVFPSTGLGGP
jgi:hypothetical protein